MPKRMGAYESVLFLTDHGLCEYSTRREFYDLVKSFERKGVRFHKNVIEYCSSNILKSAEWHSPESSLKDIKHIYNKYGTSTARWKELTSVLDWSEAAEMTRLVRGKSADSPYYFTGDKLNVIAEIFDIFGDEAYGRSGAWWDFTIFRVMMGVKEKWILKFCQWAYANDKDYPLHTKEGIEIVRQLGINKAKYYFDKGFRAKEIIDLYEALDEVPDFLMQGMTYDWDDEEISQQPSIKHVPFCGFPKGITKVSEPFDIGDAEIAALVPFIGPVNAMRDFYGYHDMDAADAKFLYQKAVENKYLPSLRDFFDPDRKTGNSFYLPRNWESWIMVKWLKDKIASAWITMSKPRIVYGPAGLQREFTYLNILDEIGPEDLVNGIKTKPDKVFEAGAKRKEAELKREMGESVRLPKAPWKDTMEVKQLIHSNELIQEGEIMHNCVRGYFHACLHKKTYIFHVGTGKRNTGATMEVTPDRKILQLYKAENRKATDDLLDMAKRWVKVNGGDFTFQLQG